MEKNYSTPFEFSGINESINIFLQNSLSPFWANFTKGLLIGIVILVMYALIAMALIYIERKIAGRFQSRLGPMRLGKNGLLQSVADVIKILIKEIIYIKRADRLLYFMAPFFVIISSVLAFGAIPFGKGLQVVDFKIGIIYILAVSSLGIIGVLLAGWSSNNKYSMLGAMRSGSQFISYELSSGFSLMTIVVLAGTMQLSEIVEGQRYCWNLFDGHIPAMIAFLIYLLSGHAETNRGPFDMPEAESELTAGYHTEFSGLKFGLFYLSEYLNMFIVAAIATTVFLGGWMPPQIKDWEIFNQLMWYIPSWAWFFLKTFLLMFLSLWVRWSFPRLRIDLLLNLEWKYLLPINLVNILVMVVIVLSGLTLSDLFPSIFG